MTLLCYKRKYLQILALIFTIVVFLNVGICSGAVVKVHSENTVATDTIYLKDIATIEAETPLKGRIENLKIGTSPSPGREKSISINLLKTRLFASVPKGQLKLELPGETIRVKREYQTISESSLRSLFTGYIKKCLSGKRIKISGIKIKGLRQKLPVGKLHIEIEEKQKKEISGHYKMIVNVTPENGKSERMMISGWVDRYEYVFFAKNDLPKGKIFTKHDIYSELTNVTKYPSDIINSIYLLKGQAAKNKIRKNSMLRQRMISLVPDIKKGEIVKLVAKSGVLTVSTIGVATENAVIGEQIQVKNIKSKKIITGLVLKEKTVEVVF